MKKWLGWMLVALGSVTALASTASAQSAVMRSSVIGSGGTRASGTGYTLNATVGQTVIGPVNDAPTNTKWDFQGFWYAAFRYQFDTTLGVVADRGISDISAGSAVLYNAPNPFSDWTNIRVILTKSDHVTLKLFNSIGQEVSTLLDENHEAGPINVRLSGHDLESGQYQVQLITSDLRRMITVVVVK